jgi:hypothetical protein
MTDIQEIIKQLDWYMEENSITQILIPEASQFLSEKSLLRKNSISPEENLVKLLKRHAILNSFNYSNKSDAPFWVIFHTKAWEKICNPPKYIRDPKKAIPDNLKWLEKIYEADDNNKPIEYILPTDLNYRLIKSKDTGLFEIAIIVNEETTKDQYINSWIDILEVRRNLRKRQGYDLLYKNGYAKHYLFDLHFVQRKSYPEITKILNYDILASIIHSMQSRDKFKAKEIPSLEGFILLMDWFYKYLLGTDNLEKWLENRFKQIDNDELPINIDDYPIESTKIRGIIRHNKEDFLNFKAHYAGREYVFVWQRNKLLESGSYEKANKLIQELFPGHWNKHKKWINKRIEKIKKEIQA